jgi:hypothetical protein
LLLQVEGVAAEVTKVLAVALVVYFKVLSLLLLEQVTPLPSVLVVLAAPVIPMVLMALILFLVLYQLLVVVVVHR